MHSVNCDSFVPDLYSPSKRNEIRNDKYELIFDFILGTTWAIYLSVPLALIHHPEFSNTQQIYKTVNDNNKIIKKSTTITSTLIAMTKVIPIFIDRVLRIVGLSRLQRRCGGWVFRRKRSSESTAQLGESEGGM